MQALGVRQTAGMALLQMVRTILGTAALIVLDVTSVTDNRFVFAAITVNGDVPRIATVWADFVLL